MGKSDTNEAGEGAKVFVTSLTEDIDFLLRVVEERVEIQAGG